MGLLNAIGKLFGFETFTIPIDSFRKQFGNMMEVEWKEVRVKDPTGFISTYKIFPIDEIKCLDESGQTRYLTNKPSLELRITDRKNKRTVFFFDTIRVKDDFITGDRSRLFGLPKEIDLKDVVKIEIQDGRKHYKYV